LFTISNIANVETIYENLACLLYIKMEYRIEKDVIGEVKVPANAYFGIFNLYYCKLN